MFGVPRYCAADVLESDTDSVNCVKATRVHYWTSTGATRTYITCSSQICAFATEHELSDVTLRRIDANEWRTRIKRERVPHLL